MEKFIDYIKNYKKKNINVKEGKILVKKLYYKIKKYKIKHTSKTLQSKMQNIKKNIKNYVSYYLQEKPTKIKLPPGLCIYDKIYSENKLEEIKSRLNRVYNKYHKEKEFMGIPIEKLFAKQENGKRIFMFDNLDVYNFCKIAINMDKKLGQYLIQYIIDIFQIFKIPSDKISLLCQNSKIVIARYESNTGLYAHLDLLRRGDGPVITMSLGADYNIYDMIPLKENKDTLRVYFPKGSLVVLNGEARYEWAHSLPYDLEYGNNDVRYSIIFLVHNFQSVKKIRSNIYKMNYDFSLHDCSHYLNKVDKN